MENDKQFMEGLLKCYEEDRCSQLVYYYIDRNAILEILTELNSGAAIKPATQKRINNYREFLKDSCSHCRKTQPQNSTTV